MRDILTGKGFPEERLVIEDKAQDTKENFRNAAKLIDPDEPVIVVSSNYHMGRAVKLAKEAGFTDVKRLPALSDPVQFGANVMWEVILEINDYVSGSKKAPPAPAEKS